MTRIGGQFGIGERAPALTEPVIGYRGWMIVDGQLRSTLAPVFWDSPEAWARCMNVGNRPGLLHRLRHPHRPPGHLCACGLYSYYESRSHSTVAGAVVNTGRIEVHRDGMRAEHQRVVAIADPGSDGYHPNTRMIAETAAREWGVPFVRQGELESVALEHGEPMPESLRPV